MADDLTDTVLARATRLAAGDASKAAYWFFNAPLKELDGKTAACLVSEGRAADVLRVIDSYEQGPAG